MHTAENLLLSFLDAPASQGLSAEHLYILIGVSVVFLFCLLLLVLFFLHHQNQMKQGRSQGQGGVTWGSCQERLGRSP